MNSLPENYTVSHHYDRRLYRQDISGSIAHARMLARQGIISGNESETITKALKSIRSEIEIGEFRWRDDLEDIHMNIERRLFEIVGDVAGKLHTARSRNDQVALDMRMYAKYVNSEMVRYLQDLMVVLVIRAEDGLNVVMPGYTHLQRAQPVLFAHHMLAYFEMFVRDTERFRQSHYRADVMPLGSGALAGVPYPIDREFVARELGFASVTSNSMDAVSDRDFLLDFHSAAATCMVHLSRLAEELVIWSSDEFGFIRLSDDVTTGSSMMPQKRNPDFAELARGRSGRVFGHQVSLLTVLKGLPLTYNRDLQEDKEGFFDTVDTLMATIQAMTHTLSTIELERERLLRAAEDSHVLATDIADYLVIKGVPFREAHGVVARLSARATEEAKGLGELSLETYRSFSEHFQDDVKSITVNSSINARDVRGGTATPRVKLAIKAARAWLEDNDAP